MKTRLKVLLSILDGTLVDRWIDSLRPWQHITLFFVSLAYIGLFTGLMLWTAGFSWFMALVGGIGIFVLILVLLIVKVLIKVIWILRK